MLRRSFLKTSAGLMAAAQALGAAPRIRLCGALPPSRRQRGHNKRAPSFYHKFGPMKGIAKDGANTYLWRALEREIGEIEPHDQSDGPDGIGEGDCVGQAAAMGCDVLAAAQIHYLRQPEAWVARASVEAIYWGSRDYALQVLVPEDVERFKTSSGSSGEWAAEHLKKLGVLHRVRYRSGLNTIDLHGYSPDRSREHMNDFPDWLEPLAKLHPVREISNVKSGTEALDAVCAGQPVLMCSSYAFPAERDADGFTVPYLGAFGIRQQWWHAMILTGAVFGDRPGGLIQNSHGPWNVGPRPHGIPAGSFFVDLKYIDLMVKDWFDCWALSSYAGHDARRIRKHLLYLR